MKITHLLLLALFMGGAYAAACQSLSGAAVMDNATTLLSGSDTCETFADFASCLGEVTNNALSTLSITTGTITTADASSGTFDFAAKLADNDDTAEITFIATGSKFTGAQYDSIITSIKTVFTDGHLKNSKVLLTFDAGDISETSVQTLDAMIAKIDTTSTVYINGTSFTIGSATVFKCAAANSVHTVAMTPYQQLSSPLSAPSTFEDLIGCYEEKLSAAQTSISITTGVLTAGGGTTDVFNFETQIASDTTATLAFDATGSNFSTAQYESIVDSIYAAKAKLSDVTITFDGNNISQSSAAKLHEMASIVNDASTVMIAGSSVTLTDTALAVTYTSASTFLCTGYNNLSYLDLSAKVPADEAAMDTCLGIINTSGSLVTTLKISYAGLDLSGGVPNFATLLSNIITQLTVLEIDASGTNLNVLPVLTGFTALTDLVLNLTGNQVSDTQTGTLITALSTLYGAIASANITTKLQQAATDLTKTVLPLDLDTIAAFTSSTKTVEVWDFDNSTAAVCSIGATSLNAGGCQFKPKLYIAEKDGTATNICATKTVDLKLVPYNMNGVTAAYTATWTLDPVPTSYSAIDTTTDSDFTYDATKFVADTEYTVTVTLATNPTPTPATLVLKESFNLTLRPCAPTVSLKINDAALASPYNCNAALVFTVNDATILDTDGTSLPDSTLTNSTTYLWAYKNADKSADITSAGAKNTNTFTIAVSELISADFVITLVIGTPEIIVEDLELTVSGCAATAFINGAALVANSSYTNCQDLVLSVGNEVTAGIVDGTTTYAWKLETGSADVLATHDPVIDNTTATITYDKDDLVVGSYTIGLDLSLPDVDITDFDIAITDGGTCGAEDSAPADVEAFILHFAASFFLLLLLTY